MVLPVPTFPCLNRRTPCSSVHVSASDPLGLEDVSDIPAVPEEEEPQGNNDVTMVIQPLSAFPTPTQSVPPTAGMTPQTVPLPPEAGAAVPPHGSGEPGGKADGSSRKQHGHRRAIIIAVVAVVVVALAATGGFLWWRHMQNQNELDQAASLCKTSKTKADKAFSELQSALSSQACAADSARRCVRSDRPGDAERRGHKRRPRPASRSRATWRWAPRR